MIITKKNHFTLAWVRSKERGLKLYQHLNSLSLFTEFYIIIKKKKTINSKQNKTKIILP